MSHNGNGEGDLHKQTESSNPVGLGFRVCAHGSLRRLKCTMIRMAFRSGSKLKLVITLL